MDVSGKEFKNDFFKAYDGFEKIFGLVGDSVLKKLHLF